MEWPTALSGVRVSGGFYVRITALGKRAVVQELFIIDANGNETTYAFKKTEWNGNVPEKLLCIRRPERSACN